MTLSLTTAKREIEYQLPPLERAMRLAGFAFAHAAGSIAEAAGPLIPVGFVERRAGLRNTERIMLRFMHPSPDEIDLALSVSQGRSELSIKLPEYDSTVLVFDGYVRRPQAPEKSDAFIIEINDVAFEAPFKVIQHYQPFGSGRFKLLGSPVFLQDNCAVGPGHEAEMAALFLDGTKSNSHAEKSWSAWRD